MAGRAATAAHKTSLNVVSDESTAAAERAKAAMEAEVMSDKSSHPAINFNKLLHVVCLPFPLSMFVVLDNFKHSLLLSSVNFRLACVVLSLPYVPATSIFSRSLLPLSLLRRGRMSIRARSPGMPGVGGLQNGSHPPSPIIAVPLTQRLGPDLQLGVRHVQCASRAGARRPLQRATSRV